MKKEITNEEIQTYIKKRITVNPNSGCWEWNLMKRKGYGAVDYETRAFMFCKTELVHRISYNVFNAPVTPSEVIRHRCNNKSCCNPEHLEPGTQVQNMADRTEPIEQQTTASLQFTLQNLLDKANLIKVELSKRNPSSV
jgi:hypothetical protein